MRFFVGVTNQSWFDFLAACRPDEVNFWRPRSQMHFKAISPGAFFLFKLHSPLNFIAGGGVFARHSFLPLPLAWQAFGEKNGMIDYKTFQSRILEHRAPGELNQQLGCTILTQPFFWPRDQWIPVPPDWKNNIVTGKGYDTSTPEGAGLWAQVEERIARSSLFPELQAHEADQARYGEGRLVHPRLGQGAFRIMVTDAYSRRCAITGERTLPALEAGHIRPYAENGPHRLDNGILLRSDLHNLFDLGYLTISPDDYRVKVSKRIKEEFQNGRHYYALDNHPLEVLPDQANARPAREFLEWHQSIFKC
jgi:putative restriction endonuclease